MVFKRYIKRGGKVYGPYYYESYRDEKGIVRKKYVGMSDPGKKGKVSRNVKRKGKSSFTPQINLSFVKVFLVVLAIILVLLVGLSLFGVSEERVGVIDSVSDPISSSFAKISGFVSSGLYVNEEVTQDFDKGVDLKIKDPPKSAGKAISKNKNKRMDFELPSGNARLYFDLLNYSEFVEKVWVIRRALYAIIIIGLFVRSRVRTQLPPIPRIPSPAPCWVINHRPYLL